jgi:DNA-binding MarR family transcriptional regulator
MHSPASLCEAIKFLAPSADAEKGLRYRALLEFMATGDDVRRAFRSQLARKGLTIEGFQALAALRSLEPAAGTPSALADKIGTTRALLSHTLTRLEISHLLTRERDVEDRRIIWLRLTEEGRQLVNEASNTCTHSVLQLVDGFNDHDIAELITSCEKLNHSATKLS